MPTYRVTWVIDVDADGPREAALQALEIMRDPASIATVFTVADDQGNRVDVDLGQEGLDPRVQALINQVLAAEELAGRRNATLQYLMDDLIYDHCGTSKKWSHVNNQGMEAQVEALVERLGLVEATQTIAEALESAGAEG
jgi:hypothetical protein